MKKFAPVFAAYSFLLLGHLLDVLTSLLPGGIEANPLARDPNYHLLLGHLLFLKFLSLGIFILCSWMLYAVISPVWEKAAILCAALVPLYETYQLFGVAFGNVCVFLRWFQP